MSLYGHRIKLPPITTSLSDQLYLLENTFDRKRISANLNTNSNRYSNPNPKAQ